MAGANPFEVEGVIVEALPNRLWRVELANGHRLLAFVAGKARLTFAKTTGDTVRLRLTPFDLSQGLILVDKATDL